MCNTTDVYDAAALQVFELMVSRNLHCIPIVDEDGVVVDVISQVPCLNTGTPNEKQI